MIFNNHCIKLLLKQLPDLWLIVYESFVVLYDSYIRMTHLAWLILLVWLILCDSYYWRLRINYFTIKTLHIIKLGRLPLWVISDESYLLTDDSYTYFSWIRVTHSRWLIIIECIILSISYPILLHLLLDPNK
jgi:hypothetical protein